MNITRFALLGLLGLACVAPAYAQQSGPPPPIKYVTVPAAPVPAAKAATIRHLLELDGTARLSQLAVTQMFATMQNQMPQVPATFWAKARTDVHADDLIAAIIPIYSREYTQADLDGFVAFYQSPLGRKAVATQPQLLQATSAVSQQWGKQILSQLIPEIRRELAAKKSHTAAP